MYQQHLCWFLHTEEITTLPWIDDLLDKLGQAKYFTTLDLKSGYWQIKVDAKSQEKTALVTHQGLYEFHVTDRVMPFGIKNAPAVFQLLMQSVSKGLKTESNSAFVDAYISR